MTTRESATATAKNALALWGGRVAVIAHPNLVGTCYGVLSSNRAKFRGREVNDYWEFMTTAQVGDRVMLECSLEAVVVEIFE